MQETLLDVLYISVSSLSCSGGLPHSLLGSDLDFFVRNILYYPELDKTVCYLLEPLIHRTYSQCSLGVILILFSLMIATLITQMPVAFNCISIDDYWFQLQNLSYLVGSEFEQ